MSSTQSTQLAAQQDFARLARSSGFGNLCRSQITKLLAECLLYIDQEGLILDDYGGCEYSHIRWFPYSQSAEFEFGVRVEFYIQEDDDIELQNLRIWPMYYSKSNVEAGFLTLFDESRDDCWVEWWLEDGVLSIDKNPDYEGQEGECRLLIEDRHYKNFIAATNEFMWWLDTELDNNSGIYQIVWADTDRGYYANSATFMLGFSTGFEGQNPFREPDYESTSGGEEIDQTEDSDDDELEVEEVDYEGTIYYRAADGSIYDPDTAEVVGTSRTTADGHYVWHTEIVNDDTADHAEIAQREVMEEVPPPYSRGSLPPPTLLASVGIFPPSYEEACALL